MKLLLTNDDGMDAEGLQELARLLRVEHECWVVAPDQGRSCCSHSVTNAEPLKLRQHGEREWDLSGTPADCVRVAIHCLNFKPDYVLSGVNHGGNLGVDTLYSGTVSAAREASMLGIPAVALSQYMRRDIAKDWAQSAFRARRVLEHLWLDPPVEGTFWNVNLPAIVPEEVVGTVHFPISFCDTEHSPLQFHFTPYETANPELLGGNSVRTFLYQSNYQTRPRQDGSDVSLCFAGHATVTKLKSFG
ncbi:5'-nucleotidase SurE [Pirellula sp. SH-Sr6A]|uniref:5'/3'-nucleotidase SurE n=1 Tax=Pirellula sp. SH-Sr6A TaxID=1632865 RepID=UPI00078C85D7|nr:5'/3'-nucleotidase SurE [Pirellula sp. SH-Sr6A]AMV32542.1 5'-nucleotidase SurE [Pirellula sp. SH-Sr6A]